MFPKNRRVPRRMFPLLSNGAKTFKNRLFLLRFVSKEGPSRYCFSVSKKIAKSAVVRNNIRRAGYRLLEKYLSDMSGNVLTLFSFRAIPKNDEEVVKNLKSILTESKLMK
jgi:ribonuclease P protein component